MIGVATYEAEGQDASDAELVERVRAFYLDSLPRLAGFKHRDAQLRMSLDVAETVARKGQAIIEAGTGTGKSLAYLVPLLLRDNAKGRPAIIATKTVQLQDQLLRKDLPALQPLLPVPRKVVQAKGWSNYACIRKVEKPDERTARELGGRLQSLRRLLVNQGGRLSRQDSPLPGPFWDRVKADPSDCQKRNCPHFNRCGLFAERRELEGADIVVTNHAFLLTDLRLRREGRGLLPDGDLLVVDEAHRLNDVATEQLAVRFDAERIHSSISAPLSSAADGWLAACRFSFLMPLPEIDFLPWSETFDRTVLLGLKDIELISSEIFLELETFLPPGGARRDLQELLHSPAGETLADLLSGLGLSLEETAAAMTCLCRDYEERFDFAAPPELVRLAQSLSRLGQDLDFLLRCEAEDWVFLAEGPPASLVARPVDNAEALRTELFGEYDAVLVTSASLRVGSSFEFFKQRTGFRSPVLEAAYPSPFDVTGRTFVGLVNSGADPSHPDYPHRLAPALLDLVTGLCGRTLLLTTSHRRVREFVDLLEFDLAAAGIDLLAQGRESPGRLLKRFASEGRHLLIGVDTFWEGVDIPGERLSCVVMTRLPFPVPQDVLFKAQAERIEREGGSSFHHLSLPLAGLKLKQGFGRLLRSETDRGIFILTDPRACCRGYGRALLENLPVTHAKRAGLPEIVEEALAWSASGLRVDAEQNLPGKGL